MEQSENKQKDIGEQRENTQKDIVEQRENKQKDIGEQRENTQWCGGCALAKWVGLYPSCLALSGGVLGRGHSVS